MVDSKELKICKRRGHNAGSLGSGWAKCKWCGIWVRKVLVIEEREDEPAKDDQDPLTALRELGKKKKGK